VAEFQQRVGDRVFFDLDSAQLRPDGRETLNKQALWLKQYGQYAITVEDLDKDSCLRQRVVYFDFNETNIKPQFQAAISCHAAYLRQFPGARVTLQGNADERGTREYNLGLGERRGNSVSSALGAAGASTAQLNVVSYGEERPVCKDHSEDCWQKNRRVEVVYTSKQ